MIIVVFQGLKDCFTLKLFAKRAIVGAPPYEWTSVYQLRKQKVSLTNTPMFSSASPERGRFPRHDGTKLLEIEIHLKAKKISIKLLIKG